MSQFEQDGNFRSQYNKLWDASVDYKRPAASASEVQSSPNCKTESAKQSPRLCSLGSLLIACLCELRVQTNHGVSNNFV